MTRLRWAGLAAMLLAILGIGAWLALRASNDDSSERSGVQGLPPLSASLGSLEVMPAAVQRRIRDNLTSPKSLRLRFDRAQHARAPIGVGVWLVEGPDVTCIFREGLPASSCLKTAEAKRNGISLGTYRTDKAHHGRPVDFLALGVVPVGIRAVRVEIVGSRRVVQAPSGVWAVRAKAAIKVEDLIR